MNLPRLNIGLPLLAKELTEQSARRRTYIIRVVYATALYGFTLWAFWHQLGSWNNNSFAILGRGRELFDSVAGLQFAGLYLFLPAMTCGVLTSEKERDTLALLLLTKLGPWTIVFEKLLGRLVPMASFLMLSTPLLAIAYSLGGVEVVEVRNLAWALSVTAFQVGAFSVLCSAWCRTTSAAFLATYLIGATLILGPPILTQNGDIDVLGLVSFLSLYLESLGVLIDEQPPFGGQRDAVFVLFGPWLTLHPSSGNLAFAQVVARSLPIGLFTLACLFAARVVLWRRAFVQPSNYVLRFFKSLDTFFHRANQNRLTRGIELIRESVTLPLFDPIRWRETKKRSLGTTRYLVRMLLALEVPVLLSLLFAEFDFSQSGVALTGIACVLWIVVTLVLTVQSTGLIGLERSRQTLDVLLTTQMPSDAMVREKFAGVWRMFRMLWVPFATVYLYRLWWQVSVQGWLHTSDPGLMLFESVAAFLAVAIYPPLIAWIGFHQGMRRRSQSQATLVTLGLIVAGCALPVLIAELITPLDARPGPFLQTSENTSALYTLRWLSPAFVLVFPVANSEEFMIASNLSSTPFLAPLIGHFLLAGGLLAVLWLRGTRTFARHVNRNDGQIVDDDDLARLASVRKGIVGSRDDHDLARLAAIRQQMNGNNPFRDAPEE